MHRIPQSTITAIRSDKQQNKSLNQIALHYGIAKATVSYYCRDLFSHPARIYQTEIDVRKRNTERAKTFTCLTCSSPTKSRNGLCGACYRHLRPHNNTNSPHKKHKLYPCRVCKTNLVRKPDGRCFTCYSKLRAEQKANLAKEREQTQKKRQVYLAQLDAKTKERSKCPNSPGGAHYWLIDSDNIGICKYCHQHKDMLTSKLKDRKKAITPSNSTVASLELSKQTIRFHYNNQEY